MARRTSEEIPTDLRARLEMSVAPSEGAIMAAPYGAKAPGLDGSEGARSL
jgi:hypothetical protein